MQALINLTITTTVTALAVLLIKGLFSKKMSARWQYYIWLVLLVRILVPVLPQSPLSVFNFTPSVQQVSVEQVPVGQDSQTSAAPSPAGGIYQGQQSADKPAQEQAPQTSAPQTGTAPPAVSQKPAEEKLYIEQVILKNQIQDTQTTVSFEVWVYRTIVWIWLGGACLLAGYFVLVYAVFCRRVKRDARAYGRKYRIAAGVQEKGGRKAPGAPAHLGEYPHAQMGVFAGDFCCRAGMRSRNWNRC